MFFTGCCCNHSGEFKRPNLSNVVTDTGFQYEISVIFGDFSTVLQSWAVSICSVTVKIRP